MLEKRTILDQIEVTRDGVLQIRLCKQIVDGETVLASEYHRTSVPPDGDCDAQFAAVNAHLVAMGCAAVSAEDWEQVSAIAAAAHTPKAKQKWAEKLAANKSPA